MLIRDFSDVIIALMDQNIYSIQLNLASVPQDDTLCKRNPVLKLI